MIYAGEEFEDSNKPNLFEKDIVNYNGTNISKFLYRLSLIKHKDIFTNGIYNISITKVKDVVEITWENEKEKIISIVDLGIQNSGKVDVELSDGNYINYINEELIKIKNHQIYFDGYPVIIHYYKTKQNQKYIESK